MVVQGHIPRVIDFRKNLKAAWYGLSIFTKIDDPRDMTLNHHYTLFVEIWSYPYATFY